MIENKNNSVNNLEKIKAFQVIIRYCDTLIHVAEKRIIGALYYFCLPYLKRKVMKFIKEIKCYRLIDCCIQF